jgi:hypothetical protein
MTKPRRIPDKVTDKDAYQRYFRDKYVLDSIQRLRETVEALARAELHPERKAQFQKTLADMDAAAIAWGLGWEQPYRSEP